ncbi:MAG TPA: ATP-binding protein [Solirubrobacteraceae bacterium]|nr:ATP-binding protein [Solirubrobacteraceae bacterium]
MIPTQDRPGTEPRFEAPEIRGRAEVPAIPELRAQVVAYAEQAGAGGLVVENLRLAVSEAITNCVVHAYPDPPPGDVTVKAWVGDDRELVVVVLDDGAGFRAAPANPGLGIGLGVMAEVSDSLAVSTRDGRPGTAVTLRFGL